jgi:HEPN domain-containing protein
MKEVTYRMRLADGFLAEARQDLELERWRSCVDNSQLAVENAAKAVLALLGPVGKPHNPAGLLRRAVEDHRFPQEIAAQVTELAQSAEILGHDVHMDTDYGSEANWRTPWELFGESDAQQSISIAENAVILAGEIVKCQTEQPVDNDTLVRGKD